MSQREIILRELRTGEWVPVTRFLNMYITRTAARVNEMREEGYNIESRRMEGKTFFEYRLVPKQESLIYV